MDIVEPVTIYHYDAFSNIAGKGNPAGVVLDADQLTAEHMQCIARDVGFNETVFVCPSKIADLRLVYYTPGHEMNLCGHATIAALTCLLDEKRIVGRTAVTIETKAGVLPIHIEQGEQGEWHITMRQDEPQFVPYTGNRGQLASLIGLSEGELHPDLPIVYGSTGIWTLLVPITKRKSFGDMVPDSKAFPNYLLQNPKASIHPFCLETVDPTAFMYARHFSSPYSGTIEDAVTGTASGVMGAYYLTYMEPILMQASFHVEQGYELGREGKVSVRVQRLEEGPLEVNISGIAAFVRKWDWQR
ncbi:PhzF family phenazine biosynthesis isomerase [Paenibacillus sp. SC116]|uniref:PhzF family phenazine biosynthesis isomerase n=1 Tax=Paenibacillus sp. SC116 TaxID=2968986 RepID=UPI00215A663B|nr:PhzF family phenazine biosynthesis isomerase [Paenibacillus sp. SC116]MCR8845105.1 PhzF family phenazine biosynthesis isomerase [Paenibacillus sp. SC116]